MYNLDSLFFQNAILGTPVFRESHMKAWAFYIVVAVILSNLLL